MSPPRTLVSPSLGPAGGTSLTPPPSLPRTDDSKAILTIGGWDGGIYFSDLVSTSAHRTSLAKKMVAFVTKYDADGIGESPRLPLGRSQPRGIDRPACVHSTDLDWEAPNSQGIGCNTIRSADSANFLLFLKELRKQLGTTKLITAAVGTAPFAGSGGSALMTVKSFATYLDYINVMTYDLVGTW